MSSAAVIEADERINEVHIEGLALLKIVKHCHDSLPQMVTGSLLGITAEGTGVLEITHAFPFPETRAAADDKKNNNKDMKGSGSDVEDVVGNAGLDGHEFQIEMMRMLREVNVDNNCVGWYQSMYLGIYSTSALLENQWSYQTDLSPNAVVLLYDPMQTALGNLVLRCYRLTEKCIQLKTSGKNSFIDPNDIFEEVPIKLENPGLTRALLSDIAIVDSSKLQPQDENNASSSTSTDITFDRLDLSTNPYLVKNLEYLCSWVDDLSSEQQKFQYYTRHLQQSNRNDKKNKNASEDKKEDETDNKDAKGWGSSDAPRRMESLLITNQIRTYCNQIDKFAGGGLGKLFLAGGLHKDEKA